MGFAWKFMIVIRFLCWRVLPCSENVLHAQKSYVNIYSVSTFTGFQLATHESWFADLLCLFMDQFEQFSVKFLSQTISSVRNFVFRETTKFLFILQAWQFTYILLQKVLNCTLCSCIWIIFWPQTFNGVLTALSHAP